MVAVGPIVSKLLVPSDKLLYESASLVLADAPDPGGGGGGKGGAGSSTPQTTAGKVTIYFQFPPKMVSDNRSGNWKEGELRGKEPIANFVTSGPREMSLQWSYIVEDRSVNGSGWTTKQIAQNVRNLRGYFARVRNAGDQRNLVVQLGLWAHTADLDNPDGPNYQMSCRIKNVNVKHSVTMIIPTSASSPGAPPQLVPKLAYPLRTDVSLEIRLWTNLIAADGKATDIKSIAADELPNWY